jgi:hypothetical protein
VLLLQIILADGFLNWGMASDLFIIKEKWENRPLFSEASIATTPFDI